MDVTSPVGNATRGRTQARWERSGGIAGIAAVGVLVATVAFESTGPVPTDSATKVARTFVTDQTGVLAGSYLLLVGMALYAIFLATLRGILRKAEGEPGSLSALVFGAGMISLAPTAVYVTIYASLAHKVAQGGGPNLVFALFRIATAIDSSSELFMGLSGIAAFLVIVRTAVFSRWLGWLALVAGILLACGAFALDDPTGPLGSLGLVGLVLFLLWTLLTSALIVRRAGGAAPVL